MWVVTEGGREGGRRYPWRRRCWFHLPAPPPPNMWLPLALCHNSSAHSYSTQAYSNFSLFMAFSHSDIQSDVFHTLLMVDCIWKERNQWRFKPAALYHQSSGSSKCISTRLVVLHVNIKCLLDGFLIKRVTVCSETKYMVFSRSPHQHVTNMIWLSAVGYVDWMPNSCAKRALPINSTKKKQHSKLDWIVTEVVS